MRDKVKINVLFVTLKPSLTFKPNENIQRTKHLNWGKKINAEKREKSIKRMH